MMVEVKLIGVQQILNVAALSFICTPALCAYSSLVHNSRIVAPVGAQSACGGGVLDLTSSGRGTITSPGYPYPFPPFANCRWRIMGAPGSRIQVRIMRLNLDPPQMRCQFGGACSRFCSGSHLKLSGGAREAFYCGTEYATIGYWSVAPWLEVHFVGGPQFRRLPGFALAYTVFPPPTTLPFVWSTVPTTRWTPTTTEGRSTGSRCGSGMLHVWCVPRCPMTCEAVVDPGFECRETGGGACVEGCVCAGEHDVLHAGACVHRHRCVALLRRANTISCGTQFFQPKLKITGGERAIKGSWPWSVQIIKGFAGAETYQCGGTIVCSGWVLTAAHCFEADNGYRLDLTTYLYQVRIGRHRRSVGDATSHVVRENIERIYAHPDYDLETKMADIALVKLATATAMSEYVRPACIPDPQPARFPATSWGNSPAVGSWGPPVGSLCYVTGWGSTRGLGPDNNELKQARLEVRDPSLCDGIYPHFDQSTMLCVGGRTNSDSCRGDSGGGLVCRRGARWYVTGVTSYGYGCGVVGEPGVYSRVGAYVAWVRGITGGACGHPGTRWRSSSSR